MRRRHLLPLLALLGAAVFYLLVAWPVPPGFFDGLAPPGPYRWTSPPPSFRKGNQPPLYGHTTIPLGSGGSVPAGTAFTRDGQASISWDQGTFAALPGESVVIFRINAQTRYPNPGSIHLSTNVYCVTTKARLRPGHQVLVTLTYSPGIEVPTTLYTYTKGDQTWQSLGSIRSTVPFTLSAMTSSVTCFAGGVEQRSSSSLWPPGPLPWVVVSLLILVVLAALPLLVRRLRVRARRPPGTLKRSSGIPKRPPADLARGKVATQNRLVDRRDLVG